MKKFEFTHRTHSGKEYFWQRVWSMLPGGLSWTILISVTALSFFKPLHAAIFIIALLYYGLLLLFNVIPKDFLPVNIVKILLN